MKASESRKFIENLKQRGYVFIDNVYYPPKSAQVKRCTTNIGKYSSKETKCFKTLKIKSGWIDDTRNLKNKEVKKDVFMRLVLQELGLEVWPEFYFSTERLYRLDYAIPVDLEGNKIKIGIEVQGGIWAKGNSGHSSGKGIKRDMDKSNLAQSLGWYLIKITPDELLSNKLIEMIKMDIGLKKGLCYGI